ncbi:MAG TPA: hypothetical protein VM120_17065 [Bryobacteraceae bacterium]|nr:hypothetical protein [Bryobacteraceae bacterium]
MERAKVTGMARVRLIGWSAKGAEERAEALRKAGHEVNARVCASGQGTRELRELSESPPDVVIIDLDRLPSHGRAWAAAIRSRKGSREVPIVLAGGDPQKLPAIRQQLPDMVFTEWRAIGKALTHAVAHPPRKPVAGKLSIARPEAPLYKKLNIRAGMSVLAIDPPREFYRALELLPEDSQIVEEGRADITIRFVRTCDELMADIRRLAGWTPLWIAWPKQTSRLQSDLNPATIREIALTAGLIDYKICAIDTTWSAMVFGRRRKQ